MYTEIFILAYRLLIIFLFLQDGVSGRFSEIKKVKAYIFLTPDSKRALEVLTRYRPAVGVRPTNKYIFARLIANTSLSGTTAMKE